MDIKHYFGKFTKLGIGMTAIALLLAGCGGGGGDSAPAASANIGAVKIGRAN